jgi:hypothetical protein
LFTKRRDERGLRALDDLAASLESGAISRSKAIKLGGAALLGSALGLFASQNAQAEDFDTAASRRRCNRRGGDFCRNRAAGPTCKICCGRDRDGGGGGAARRAAVRKGAIVAAKTSVAPAKERVHSSRRA